MKEDCFMAAKCFLVCSNMNQQVDLALSESPKDISSFDFSNCLSVFEDGSYEIDFLCDDFVKSEVEYVEVFVNRKKIGNIVLKNDEISVKGKLKYNSDIYAKQPFLLNYDFVVLSFVLNFVDGTSKEFFSDLLLCVSKNQEDVENIKNIIQEIMAFDDSQIGEWIFSENRNNDNNSLYEGSWNKRTFKSLSSYIQLIQQVVSCYKGNYAYFKMQGKHTIIQSSKLLPYEKVRTLSNKSLDWIMQNTDQLALVNDKTGISYQGKHYIPYSIKTISNKKSWNVYENRIIIGFLYTVLLNAEQVKDDYSKDILNEERIISRIHGSFPKEYSAPIITIKSLQISYGKILLKKLNCTIAELKSIRRLYKTIFDVPEVVVLKLPRKTGTFCEIKPYVQVFEIIVRWFNYGEYSLAKEQLILHIKTLDKLFEYYCLLSILKLLADNGYQKSNIKEPVYKYEYTLADSEYQNEKDVANTYKLFNGKVYVTVYYQPVISAVNFENEITLFRTTKNYNKDYYTPDFVLKFYSDTQNEEYVVFDSKFSSRDNIKRYSLEEVILKYSCEFASTAENRFPKMVWVLQGRVRNFENPIWKFHNSRLASRFLPTTSYGIVSINTSVDVKQRLWNEIKQNISLL